MIGVPHPHTGEAVKAYVVLRPGSLARRGDADRLLARPPGAVQVPEQGHLRRVVAPQHVGQTRAAKPRRRPAHRLSSPPDATSTDRARDRRRREISRSFVKTCTSAPNVVGAWQAIECDDGFPRRPLLVCRCTCASCPTSSSRASRRSRRRNSPNSRGVNAAKVRKDLSYLGSYGTRGVGYDTDFLVYQIRRELGLTHDWPVVIVGAGNLGQALAGYNGFGDRGFPVGGHRRHRRRQDRLGDRGRARPSPRRGRPGGAAARHLDRRHRHSRRTPRRTPPTRSSPPASRAS